MQRVIEIWTGAEWEDITDDVLKRDGIEATYGRPDEAPQVDPGGLEMSLRDEDRTGKYNPRVATSPLYGQIGRNTPIRVGIPIGESALFAPGKSGSFGAATTPDVSALDITGDIDIRVDATLKNWTTRGEAQRVELIGKAVPSANQASWALTIQDGYLRLDWSTDGTAFQGTAISTAPLVVPMTGRLAVRATLDVNNGASGRTIAFYIASTIDGTWTQLGSSVVQAGTTGIFASTAALWLGNAISGFTGTYPRGYFHAVQVRNGIGGTAAASADFRTQTPGATSFTDAAGRTWTILTADGAEITDRHVIATQEVTTWPTRWHKSGHDVHAPIKAAGVMQRVQQGDSPVSAANHRALLDLSSAAQVIAYWPLGDGDDATQAASALPGGTPLIKSGAIEFVEGGPAGGTGRAVQVGNGPGLLTGAPGRQPASCWTMINFWIDVPAGPLEDGISIKFAIPGATDPAVQVFVVGSETADGVLFFEGQLFFEDRNEVSGSAAQGPIGPGAVAQDIRGTGPRMVTVLNLDKTNTLGYYVLQTYLDGAVSINLGATGSLATAPITQVKVGAIATFAEEIAGNPPTSATGTISELSIQAIPITWTTAQVQAEITRLYKAGLAYAGETAGSRALRLGTEAGVSMIATGDVTAQTPMGPQGSKAWLELLQECALADGGILYEQRRAIGLAYRGHDTLLNQSPAVTIPYGWLAELEDEPDDLGVCNDFTASRPDGSSYRAVREDGPNGTSAPPVGAGVYDSSGDFNVQADDLLASLAEWLVHVRTWDEARYPTVPIMLHRYPQLVPLVTLLEPGDRIRVTDIPAWAGGGDLDLLVDSFAHDLMPEHGPWVVALNCTPARPYDVAVAADALVWDRVDTAGSELTAGINSTATSISVTATAGAGWTTDAADMPLQIRVGGEVMTVTAVSGASSPQTFTVVRSANGVVKSHGAGSDVRLAKPTYVSY